MISRQPPLLQDLLPHLDQPPGAPMVAASTAQLLLNMALEGDPARETELCQTVGIDPAVLTHPDGRLPRASVDLLAERLAALTGDPHLGFRALQRSHPSVFQVVGYAMLGCTSLLEAMRCLARCLPILDDSLRASVARESGGYRLLVDSQAPPPPPLLLDTGLAALMGFCRFMAGGQPLRLHEISFPYPAPADLSAHRALLGSARLHFDAPKVSILLDAAQLERRLTGASPALQTLQRHAVRLQLDAARRGRLLSSQVHQHIVEQLDGRAPTLHSIAQAMGRSARSLQRELSMEGTAFTTLLDDSRRSLAHLYLQHSQVPLKELSYQLGFGELSSFYRACMRWFGQTPLSYRRAATAAAPAARGAKDSG